eukprot:737075-Amphidinium_carterae.1
MSRSEFIELDHLVCKTFEPTTGILTMYSLDEWLLARHIQHTLISHGDSDLGKTQLAKALVAELATKTQEGCGRPVFVKVETVDVLRLAQQGGYMKP